MNTPAAYFIMAAFAGTPIAKKASPGPDSTTQKLCHELAQRKGYPQQTVPSGNSTLQLVQAATDDGLFSIDCIYKDVRAAILHTIVVGGRGGAGERIYWVDTLKVDGIIDLIATRVSILCSMNEVFSRMDLLDVPQRRREQDMAGFIARFLQEEQRTGGLISPDNPLFPHTAPYFYFYGNSKK